MTRIREEDTIAAISTPMGPGGIGIVRMSGTMSLDILKKVFRPFATSCEFQSHRLYYGHIVCPDTQRTIDEALCVYMKAPKTYTREDVVEIQCHAGHAVLSQILNLCIAQGARLAHRGEFTLRAFLNGRIDLIQAEAVADLSSAEASGLSSMGVEAVRGELSKRIVSIKEQLVACLAALEVAIDYPEDHEEIMEDAQVVAHLEQGAIRELVNLIEAFERSRLHRFGASILLVGSPNAGKSSLLNALACEDKAIVTEVPGTTRDVVEARIEIQGICVTLLDTAGVRHEPDPIEAMGINKIRQLAPDSSLFLWILDISEEFRASDKAVMDMLNGFAHIPSILVFNKTDMVGQHPKALAEKILKQIEELNPRLANKPHCLVSALKRSGLQQLQELIKQSLLGPDGTSPDVAPNLRQKEVLEKALKMARQALNGLQKGLSPEIPALDIRQALDYLGETTGETATEDILEQIFSRFCLGK